MKPHNKYKDLMIYESIDEIDSIKYPRPLIEISICNLYEHDGSVSPHSIIDRAKDVWENVYGHDNFSEFEDITFKLNPGYGCNCCGSGDPACIEVRGQKPCRLEDWLVNTNMKLIYEYKKELKKKNKAIQKKALEKKNK